MPWDGALGLGQTTEHLEHRAASASDRSGVADSLAQASQVRCGGCASSSSAEARTRSPPLRACSSASGRQRQNPEVGQRGPPQRNGAGPKSNRAASNHVRRPPPPWAHRQLGQAHGFSASSAGGCGQQLLGAASELSRCRRNNCFKLPGAARLCSSWGCGHIKFPTIPTDRPSRALSSPPPLGAAIEQVFRRRYRPEHPAQRRRSSACQLWRGLAVRIRLLPLTLQAGRRQGQAAIQHPGRIAGHCIQPAANARPMDAIAAGAPGRLARLQPAKCPRRAQTQNRTPSTVIAPSQRPPKTKGNKPGGSIPSSGPNTASAVTLGHGDFQR